MKSGFKSTEFWFRLVQIIIGAVMASGWATPDDIQGVNANLQFISDALLQLSGMGIAGQGAHAYNKDRTGLKANAGN